MQRQIFYMPTMTQAIRGRAVLASVGVRAFVGRNTDMYAGSGCGYVLQVPSDDGNAAGILMKNGVRITRTEKVDEA